MMHRIFFIIIIIVVVVLLFLLLLLLSFYVCLFLEEGTCFVMHMSFLVSNHLVKKDRVGCFT